MIIIFMRWGTIKFALSQPIGPRRRRHPTLYLAVHVHLMMSLYVLANIIIYHSDAEYTPSYHNKHT